VSRFTFQNCDRAIDILAPANVKMGDLGNASTKDDGGNTFKATNTWFIYNDVATGYKAEGNSFPWISAAAIGAKIHDRLDTPGAGLIDIDPLYGGVHPTGDTSGTVVSVASAVPTAGGAEIAYALSASADVTVTVRNIAGRPVATVVRDQAASAGLQRLVWSGRADSGLKVPAGSYLVEIAARSADGGQSRALTTLRMD
jgi:hypothetical protein